jgi:hypothetical protein
MESFIRALGLELAATVAVATLAYFAGRYLGLFVRLGKNWRIFNLARLHVVRTYNGWNECEKDLFDCLKNSTYAGIINMKGRRLSKSPPYTCNV